jgi:hypothetical protein
MLIGAPPQDAAKYDGDQKCPFIRTRSTFPVYSDRSRRADAPLRPLAAIGSILTNQRPDFDSRSYGYGKLSDLITATTLFEIERRSPGDGKQALMYAREKPRAAPVRKSASARSAPSKAPAAS